MPIDRTRLLKHSPHAAAPRPSSHSHYHQPALSSSTDSTHHSPHIPVAPRPRQHHRPPPSTADSKHPACDPSAIEDSADRAIAAEALKAATSLSNPDTATVESSKRVPILRVRRDAAPPQRKPRVPTTIGRYLPLWYALPSLEAFRRTRNDVGEPCSAAHKPFDFAPMRPGRMQTYKYETQAAYYEQYAKSLFAITATKAGVDCLRHYEILASGSVPYFVNVDTLAQQPLTMHAFPRELVEQARSLRGVPSAAAVGEALRTDGALVINRSAFDMRAYCTLRAKLLAHTEAYLTSTTLASYVLEQARLANPMALGGSGPLATPRVLFVSSIKVSGDTWQNAFLYHGLVSLLGTRLSSLFGRKEVLYSDFVYPHRFCCYGRGYSYARTLPTPPIYRHCRKEYADALLRDQLRRRLDGGFFNLIIVTTHSNKCCGLSRCYGSDAPALLNAYLRKHSNRTVAVATVDGSDAFGGCGGATFAPELDRIDAHFLREVDQKVNGRTARLVRAPQTQVLPPRA